MINMKSLMLAALFALSMITMVGCKDESGSAYVKPNTTQANRYKQGAGHGAPPGVSGTQSGADNNAPK